MKRPEGRRAEAALWRAAKAEGRAPMQIIALLLSSLVGLALDPSLPPGGNFDLTKWKLTLPDAKSMEIAGVNLGKGFVDPLYFFTGTDGAMTFWCPVTGGTTPGSAFPRCELRETFNPKNINENWPGYGMHTLDAQCKVTQVPSNTKVIVGQIHTFTGNAYPLVRLLYTNGIVAALVQERPGSPGVAVFPFGNIGLGDLITYQLALTDGLLSMTVNGSNRVVNLFETDPGWSDQTFYFKAGNYCQDNSGTISEGAAVSFYQLAVTHVSIPDPTLPTLVITNFTFNASGQPSFTLLGKPGENHFIQISTNLATWSYRLITNSNSGIIEFKESGLIGSEPRYYRGGSF